MNKKILHMNEPIINTYNSYGSILSMIADDENAWLWLYNNFIQIRYVYSWNSYFFDNHHLFFDNCPYFYHYNIPKSILLSKWNGSMKDFIVDSINGGLYIYLYVDRYYISESSSYNRASEVHEVFIYGYDIEDNSVYIADNLLDGKYIRTKVPFEEIENGYFNIKYKVDFFLNLHLFKKSEGAIVNFDFEQVVSSINNYLYSKKTIDVSFSEKCIFGLDAVERIVDILDNVSVQEDMYLDIRALHLFYEHKLLMKLRLEYMVNKGFLVNGEKFIEAYSSLNKNYGTIRNLALKYNITKMNNILLRISELLKDQIATEKMVLNELLDRFS
ncbi:hypothetical protein [Clostridium cellulovorans]|uniref:Butirosin biosynthesis protein H N-terminal domain-containing protein n=1 Tax=Clostridium cellulovorans (strain ATCC 35296 / DSM 3052 / OCM 3 / 743B) TaxID=573061 RepID=D9SMH7_CLOC7|nr:hypothetical protein [Clostridium cellulovorans]ADL53833.1 hypothetical protein Clocel_4172 [Clostridium cellulovorans 743B]